MLGYIDVFDSKVLYLSDCFLVVVNQDYLKKYFKNVNYKTLRHLL